VTRLLAAAVSLALVAGMVGCPTQTVPNCTVTTTDGVVLHGAVSIGGGRIYIVGDGLNVSIAKDRVARIDHAPQPEVAP